MVMLSYLYLIFILSPSYLFPSITDIHHSPLYILIFILWLPFLLPPFNIPYIFTYLRTTLSVIYTHPTESEYSLYLPFIYLLIFFCS
jgi:hypothetical protein